MNKEIVTSNSHGLKDWFELAKLSDEQARNLLPYADAIKIKVLPLGIRKLGRSEFLSLLSFREITQDSIEVLKLSVGMPIEVEAVGWDESEFKSAIDIAYGCSEKDLNQRLIASKIPQIKINAPQNEQRPIPLLLSGIIERAIAYRASDIHIQPLRERYQVIFRLNGRLNEKLAFLLEYEQAQALIRRIITLTETPFTHPEKPIDGSIQHQQGETIFPIRISVLPTILGPKVVLRILNSPTSTQMLEELGLAPEQQELLYNALAKARGAIFLSGPTGSGKTTLLYTLIESLRLRGSNIVTIEDPVERRIEGITQVEISDKLSYQSAFKSILRQDPDHLMVGEIRDTESAEIALNIALSGHLVLTTVHAGSAIEVITRLKTLKVDPKLIALSTLLTSSQRLIPLLCNRCKIEIKGDLRTIENLKIDHRTCFYQEQGCQLCNFTGHHGRTGVFEFLYFDDKIKRLIESETQITKLEKNSRFRNINFQIRELLLKGLISQKSAFECLGMSFIDWK